MNVYLILGLAAVLGTFGNWLQQRRLNNVVGNPIDYLMQHKWNTLGAIIGTCAAVGGYILLSGSDGLSPGTAFYVGITTGYTADNLFNKGPKP